MRMELGLTLFLLGETRAMFIVAMIIFDFLALIYGKAALVGMTWKEEC